MVFKSLKTVVMVTTDFCCDNRKLVHGVSVKLFSMVTSYFCVKSIRFMFFHSMVFKSLNTVVVVTSVSAVTVN